MSVRLAPENASRAQRRMLARRVLNWKCCSGLQGGGITSASRYRDKRLVVTTGSYDPKISSSSNRPNPSCWTSGLHGVARAR